MTYKKFLVTSILAIILTLLMNFPSNNPVFHGIRNTLGILFLLFFPGYLFADLIFNKELDTMETLAFSIFFSISLAVLVSMVTFFIGWEISVVRIFNILMAVSFVLILANLFKKPRGRIKSTGEGEVMTAKDIATAVKDKRFYLYLFLFIGVLSVLIYLSSSFTSKEEFVELYWTTSKVENLKEVAQVSCEIENCSLSHIYKTGEVELNNKSLSILVTDLDESGKYDAFCIDTNNDEKYCSSGEGPFRYYETFFVGSSPFNSLDFEERQIVFVNYPNYVFVKNFTVSFIAKSFYLESSYFDIDVSVNGSLQYNEAVVLEPKQEIVRQVNISLPSKGLYKVEALVKPAYSSGPLSSIGFWVNSNI